MNDEIVAALARLVGVPLPPERVRAAAAALEAQIAAGGGSTAAELDGVEPATVFDPRWER
jgi:hypothetical protein